MPTPTISLIILNWNGRPLLQRCLEHVLPSLPASAEIIVVDNGSHDGSAQWLYQAYPAVRLLALARNRGFSGGVNAGLAISRGEYLVLLNNDAFAKPDFLQQLVAPLESDQTLGATAGVLTFEPRPDIIASAGINIYRDGVALDAFMLQLLAELPSQTQPIWGASGGAVAYRRQALRDVGVFDEGYFAYLEDVDLAWRLRLRGWQSVLVPQAQAEHAYSATGGENSPFKNWLLARNRWRVILRCVPTTLLKRDLASMLKYDALACSQAILRGNWTTITGRLAVTREWSGLLNQRRSIQKKSTTSIAELEPWIQPSRSIRQVCRDMQTLQRILAVQS